MFTLLKEGIGFLREGKAPRKIVLPFFFSRFWKCRCCNLYSIPLQISFFRY